VAVMRRGRFISIEGGEGTGKSTQLRRLAARLRKRGINVVETREPGGTPGAEIVRHAVLSGQIAELGPFAEALLLNAARDDHLDEVIRPALERGAWVLCDRFADSTRVYQGTMGGVEADILSALEQTVIRGTWPDLTIVLDLDPAIGLARARSATREEGIIDADRFEDAAIEDHRRMRQAFLNLAAAEPDRFAVVSAVGGPDEIEERLWDLVSARLLTVAESPDAGSLAP